MSIAGYSFGSVAPSPVTAEDLAHLEASVLFGEEDRDALRRAGDILEPQVEDILDVWYGFVASNPHLVAYFSTREGEPLFDYLEAVRPRFGQWILDTCRRPHDESWLAYQAEIARRHTREAKNKTDGVDSVDHIPLRYVIALIYPITATMREFLAKEGADDAEVDVMQQAWFKSVVLQVALWAHPYAGGDW